VKICGNLDSTVADLISTARRLALVALWLAALPAALAAGTMPPAISPAYDYAKPELFTGTLYEIGSDRKKPLFTFQRRATRSGDTVHVERRYFGTNGDVAVLERLVYESNQLVSYRMQEFQAQVSGTVLIARDPKNPAQQQIFISYGAGLRPPPGEAQDLPPDTLVDDTLYPFMMAHWKELLRGNTVKFRFISFEWERTFAFELVKTAESVQHGRAVVVIRMKPASVLIAQLIDPLDFTVEKDNPHLILSYTGRTTPRIQKGKSWKYLDAETVFDWK
jgi:hypothetical protein